MTHAAAQTERPTRKPKWLDKSERCIEVDAGFEHLIGEDDDWTIYAHFSATLEQDEALYDRVHGRIGYSSYTYDAMRFIGIEIVDHVDGLSTYHDRETVLKWGVHPDTIWGLEEYQTEAAA